MDNDKLRALARKLHALMFSSNPGERETARTKLEELLAKNKLTPHDLSDLLRKDDRPDSKEESASDTGPNDGTAAPPALDLIRRMLERHLHVTDHELTALALWIAHTFFYHQFGYTPRCALLSPVRGCGKTTVLDLLAELAFKAQKIDHTTPAALFHAIDREQPTMLLDEVDNQDLHRAGILRTVLNGGCKHNGNVQRFIRGETKHFSTFAPVALAAIGTLPLPLMDRSIVIHMERAPIERMRFDPKTIPGQAQQCAAVYQQMFAWAQHLNQQSKLNLNPQLPAGVINRQADNWRVLLSIADAAGPEWSNTARATAVAMCAGLSDEDPAVTLLSDIRDVFNALRVDRIASVSLVAALLEAADGQWSEWRGPTWQSGAAPAHAG